MTSCWNICKSYNYCTCILFQQLRETQCLAPVWCFAPRVNAESEESRSQVKKTAIDRHQLAREQTHRVEEKEKNNEVKKDVPQNYYYENARKRSRKTYHDKRRKAPTLRRFRGPSLESWKTLHERSLSSYRTPDRRRLFLPRDGQSTYRLRRRVTWSFRRVDD